ncbi:lipopolysaccharide biosynthesis protein [Achromobacter xylosoxidans]|uniref:lipopolysaccharide biosynthesis protein n=1 Tax=Alcaligenes xylosoxydans xylosoxydans TaxID=85698 RepID=UPI0006C8E574|nr:oligosaccharide flippase family protein [Achromobacter xylosoxidans]
MSFRKNVLAMLSGTVLAQAIPLLVMPLLTRLYSPEAIGLQTLFMGSTAALGVAATCRFDLAVVLPERDEDAYQLGALVLLIGTFTAMLASLAIWFFGPLIAEQTGYPGLTAWLGLLPLMMLGTMLTLLGTAYASRERSFTQVAKANVANQALYAVAALLVGYIGANTQGLVVAKVLGQWTSVLVIMLACGYGVYRSVRDFDYREIQRLAKRYRQFLYFNTPYSFIGTVARDMPIFVFSSLGATSAAGFYGLTRTVLLAPTLLVSASLSQVFFREAVAFKGTPHLQSITLGLLKLTLLAGAPLFAFCTVWGDVFFGYLFGDKWQTAGTYAMILAPAAWLALQTGWPERLFEVAQRQHVSFTIQVSADIITAVAVILPLALGNSIIGAIIGFAVANSSYHVVYLVAIFRVSQFDNRPLMRALSAGSGVYMLATVALVAVRLGGGPSMPWLILAAALAAIIAATLALAQWQPLARTLKNQEAAT